MGGRCLALEEAHTLGDVAATQGAVEQRLVAHQAAAHVAAGQEDDLGLEEKEEEEEERRQRTARPEQGSPLLCPSLVLFFRHLSQGLSIPVRSNTENSCFPVHE